MQHDPKAFFSADYAAARMKFLAAARAQGARIEEARLPHLTGPGGEPLAIDFAAIGNDEAEAGLVLISATHGVEGYCGSACQSGLLLTESLADAATRMRILFVHAHNPYGFAHDRRVNEDNVDLNRNYIDHNRPYPENQGYEELRGAIAPARFDEASIAAANQALRAYGGRHGGFALQEAITRGQYRHPTGLYFGGNFPTWSNRTLSERLPRLMAAQTRVAVIDFHTGLGPSGYGEIISEYDEHSGGARRLSAWFLGEAKSTRTGESVSADLTGTLDSAIPGLFPRAETTGFALEFGTVPSEQVFQATRADNWLHLYGDLKSPEGRAIKAGIRAAFYQETDEWKRAVWARALDVTLRTVKGLAP